MAQLLRDLCRGSRRPDQDCCTMVVKATRTRGSPTASSAALKPPLPKFPQPRHQRSPQHPLTPPAQTKMQMRKCEKKEASTATEATTTKQDPFRVYHGRSDGHATCNMETQVRKGSWDYHDSSSCSYVHQPLENTRERLLRQRTKKKPVFSCFPRTSKLSQKMMLQIIFEKKMSKSTRLVFPNHFASKQLDENKNLGIVFSVVFSRIGVARVSCGGVGPVVDLHRIMNRCGCHYHGARA